MYYYTLQKQFSKLEWSNPFTKRKLGIVTMIENKNISLPTRPKLIGKGSYGKTYELKECSRIKCTNKTYILKVIKLKDGLQKSHIKSEVHKAWLDLISFWGVNSHCYSFFKYKSDNYGLIIMDHVLRKYPVYEFSTMRQYINKYGNTQSLKDSLVYTLSYFYRTAKVHGDLHSDNILVLHDKKTVFKTKIIDYFTVMNNNSKKFNETNSIYNRMKKSEKILIHNQLKTGSLKVYKNGLKAINSAPNLSNVNIPKYIKLTKSMKDTPAIFRSNINILSYNQPQLMNYIKSIKKTKKKS